MYDPEEACNENEANQDTKEDAEQIDDKWVEINEVATREKEQEQAVEIKTEPLDGNEEEVKVVANSPRTRRTATGRNVTGPKAKRGRK